VTFKVGDVCVLVKHTPGGMGAKPIGAECQIVGPEAFWPCIDGSVWFGFRALFPGERMANIQPRETLRLKHIPPDDTHLPADEEFTDWLRKQCGVKA
jgi:hypothetical protein